MRENETKVKRHCVLTLKASGSLVWFEALGRIFELSPICRHFTDSLNALVKFRFHFTEEEIQAQRSENNLDQGHVCSKCWS